MIVKNEQGQYMVVSGQQPQVQQQQHIQQQPVLSQQFKFNTVRVCTAVVIYVDDVKHGVILQDSLDR